MIGGNSMHPVVLRDEVEFQLENRSRAGGGRRVPKNGHRSIASFFERFDEMKNKSVEVVPAGVSLPELNTPDESYDFKNMIRARGDNENACHEGC